MKRSSQSFLYASLAVVLWGTIATAFKIALAEMHIVTMLGIATLVSTFVIFLIVLFSGKIHLLKKMSGREVMWSALLGFINPLVYYIILLNAYSRLPGQVAHPGDHPGRSVAAPQRGRRVQGVARLRLGARATRTLAGAW